MEFRPLIPLLVLCLAAPQLRALADEPAADLTDVAAATATPLDPTSPPTPWFLGRLEDRFEILAVGHQLLRDAYDIDAVVGDPWTLEPETQTALDRLPHHARLHLASLAADHLDDASSDGIYMPEDRDGRSVLSIEMGDGGTQDFLNALQRTAFSTLRAEEIIDLGVFLISKAPFFPKSPDGWRKLKDKIVLYDVYLALLGVTAGLAVDKGRIGFGGWLFKAKGGDFRVGWYVQGRDLGWRLRPGYSAGLRARGYGLEASAGVTGDLQRDERFAVEATVRNRWWSRALRDSGWDWRGAVRARWIFKHVDPAQENIGHLSGTTTLTKNGFLGRSNLSIAALATVGVSTQQRVSGGATALLESGHGSWYVSMNAAMDSAGLKNEPDRDFRFTAAVGGSTESRFGTARGNLASAAERVRRDLGQIERHRLGARQATDEAKRQHALQWLGKARGYLQRHLDDYATDARAYERLRSKGDGPAQVIGLSDAELADARRALEE